ICKHFHVFLCSTHSRAEPKTLSLHDALPISPKFAAYYHGSQTRYARQRNIYGINFAVGRYAVLAQKTHYRRHDKAKRQPHRNRIDRKSTRLNSSHVSNSYAVFCLKKKKKEDR